MMAAAAGNTYNKGIKAMAEHNFHETTQAWVEDRFASGEIAEATLNSYKASLRIFAARSATPETVEAVTHLHVRAWVGSMRRRTPGGEPLSNATVYNRLSALRSFFRWAIEEELVDVDPMARVRNPKLAQREPRDLEDHVVRAAIEGAPAHVRLMMLLAVHLGLRRAEIASLAVADIRLESRDVIVFGKGSKERTLPLVDAIMPELVCWLARPDADKSRWVFPSPKGKGKAHLRPERVGQLFKQYAPPGTLATTHQYRHTAAVGVLRQSGDIRQVQQMLGHADIGTTTRYLNKDTSRLRDAMSGRSYLDDEPSSCLSGRPRRNVSNVLTSSIVPL